LTRKMAAFPANCCKRCRRTLTDEQSIKRGYGAVCFSKIQQGRIDDVNPLLDYEDDGAGQKQLEVLLA